MAMPRDTHRYRREQHRDNENVEKNDTRLASNRLWKDVEAAQTGLHACISIGLERETQMLAVCRPLHNSKQ